METNAEVFVSKYQLDAVNFDVFNDQRLIQENEVLDTGLKFDGRFSLNDRFSLHSGYQFFEIGVTNLEDINAPRFRRLIKKVIRSHAAFGEVSYGSKSGSTNARLGLRGNYFSKFDKFIFEPRLAFSQQFLKYFTWEVLGEFKNQTATQTIDLQNDFLGIEKRRWVLSDNDSIPIVQSKQISIGVNFHKNDLLISLDGYIKNVEGITTASQGFQNQFQFIPSTGNYEVVGIDLLINQQIDRFRLWMSYSATENTYDFPELMPPSFPNNLDIRHTVSFGTSYQSDRFQASIGFNWNSGRPFTPALGITNDEIGFHSPNSDHLRDYLRLDISAKYNFQLNPKVKAQIGASVWNALDRENIFNQYYQVGDNGLQPITQNALGLTPNLTFRVSF
ncbi:MAG: TonB-dependent receptor [Bacteroidota bacterium]